DFPVLALAYDVLWPRIHKSLRGEDTSPGGERGEGPVFALHRHTPTGKRRGTWSEHESLRRYASPGRHCVDPLCLFHRRVRDAWSWPSHQRHGYVHNTPERHVS